MSSSVTLNKKVCEKWIKKRTIHPITGEKIIAGSSEYKNLFSSCIKNGFNIDFCVYKWLKLEDDDCLEYGKSSYIKCHYCKSFKPLFAIHDDEIGDYQCIYCNKDIKLVYKCIRCRKSNTKLIEKNKDDVSSVTNESIESSDV